MQNLQKCINEHQTFNIFIMKTFQSYISNHKINAYEYVGMAMDASVAIIPTNDW